jgi:hypothetical protein
MGSNTRTRTRDIERQGTSMKEGKLYANSVKYGFNQVLDAPASEAFDWCTDYQPYDLALMRERGRRTIRKITQDTIILIETTRKKNRQIRKTKLVRLNRPDRSWTNTHIDGPQIHSQFLYKIEPEGKTRSRLFFYGLLVCYSNKKLTRNQLRKIAREERLADSMVWHHLAAALRDERASR